MRTKQRMDELQINVSFHVKSIFLKHEIISIIQEFAQLDTM